VYSFTLAVDIDAPPARVWRALCDPAEVVQWDVPVVEALDAPADYPKSGQDVRWRLRTGGVLRDRPQEVVPERKLRSLITVGGGQLDETYTLEPRGAGTHLEMLMHVRVPLPVVGWLVERLYGGPTSRKQMAQSLGGIKKHCEASP
jgi:uncharacterized protein YndB with AHSA1/START domain